MQTVGILLVYGLIVWAAFAMSKKGTKTWTNWAAFAIGGAGGLMLLGTAIPGWLGAIPGSFVAYTCAAGVIFCAITLLIDLPDGKADRPAITAALVGPLMVALGWDTTVSVVQSLLSGGANTFTSSIG